MDDLLCPVCGKKMLLLESLTLTYPSGKKRLFWSCPMYPLCSVQHGAHPDGSPVGFPADAKTRRARTEAHEAFDALWRGLGMTRDAGYELLQEITGLSEDAAHIGKFNYDQCAALVAAVELLKETKRAARPEQ
jgi:hypothetical protein